MRKISTSRYRKTNSPTPSAPRGRTTPSRRSLAARQQRKRLVKRKGSAVKGAENRLKNFRQASILAVAITGFFLMVVAPSEAGLGLQEVDTLSGAADSSGLSPTDSLLLPDSLEQAQDSLANGSLSVSSKAAAGEAIGALQKIWNGFYYNLPRVLIALGALVLAWLLSRLLKQLLKKAIGHWHSSGGVLTLVSLSIWLFAIGLAVSVVAGDIRALVGSLGLVGLALSWSLQTPIESFTGWLLNSFQGYYRVGDRIRVGEVFGDVYRIDFLTTTVWEIGAPYQPGIVQAEQPTGRMVTFPNNEILTGTVINLTGDFPYVWDELAVAVANESKLDVAMAVIERVALDLLGNLMMEPARQYAKLLQRAELADPVADKPQVFVSLEDSWTNITVRYLVGARERRKWKSELTFRIVQELNKPEYVGVIKAVYPRQQVQFISPEGAPVAINEFGDVHPKE
ncbi:mechanosensitive ion channel family protein [Rufibacter quisquiliarum]|uniref:Small-conductance mechanosensitive channel n=1 Tax=Rufibacter quisquiliarum TaxID=1549639 RepID=A0A839GY29_9BACT|nr:mechanosensitive ion channel domain-containing protein [Rufibacter quisquiliarum]MBA9078601.1 small-conductance mechanosensitive channel [Rufibacter quisquiliarum]